MSVYFARRIVYVLALLFITGYSIPLTSQQCSADELTVKQFRAAHSKLKASCRNVQGTFRTYRIEKPLPAAVGKTPVELKMPVVKSGTLWRNEKRFRADYKIFVQGKEKVYSVAEDAENYFEFTGGLTPTTTDLFVYGKGDSESQAVKVLIENSFYSPLDSLWSINGVAFADLLQRPQSSLTATDNEPLAGGHSILLSMDNLEVQYRFEPSGNYPFGHTNFQHSFVKLKRRVYSREVDGIVFPRRVIDVAETPSGSGYTEVVELDLELLQEESPLSGEISDSSFRNLGLGYQVHHVKSRD